MYVCICKNVYIYMATNLKQIHFNRDAHETHVQYNKDAEQSPRFW